LAGLQHRAEQREVAFVFNDTIHAS